MNGAHYHLIFNHLPIIIPFIGSLILIGGFLAGSEIVKRTAFLIFILGAMLTVPAFLTGDGAEEIVEHFEGVSEKMIHHHEEEAQLFSILSYVLGILALASLWANWKKKLFSNILGISILVFSLIVLYFGMETANSGGEIRHTEIRNETGSKSSK